MIALFFLNGFENHAVTKFNPLFFFPQSTGCFIGGTCYEDAEVNVINSCQVCRELENPEDWSESSCKFTILFTCIEFVTVFILFSVKTY